MLLLGPNGQVGHELSRLDFGGRELRALDRSAADLADPESLRAVIREHRPAAVLNAAAYTAVDRAESEPEVAARVNADAPRVLAEETARIGACLVHYSTDYVFDGGQDAPYVEADAPRPLSTYGRTKLAGERAVLEVNPRSLVFRVSWVFGVHGANFLRTMLRLARERSELRVVADQWGAPTSAALIANVTATVLRTMLYDPHPAASARWGLYHLTAAGETNWHAYAQYILEQAANRGMSLKARPDAIAAIGTVDYPTAAARPASSRLDTGKLRGAFGLALPDWTRGVDETLDQLTSDRTP
jgi:dTDP-4-dehydrorhamnose reductase